MSRKIKSAVSRSHEEATVESFRKDPMFAAEYLNSILEDGDQEELMVALRRMSKAFGGVSKLAEEAELNATTLYRTLSPKGNPELKSLTALLRAMGMQLAVRPLAEKRVTSIPESPVNVIDMTRKIRFIADQVLPKPMLPERTLMPHGSPSRHPLRSMKTYPTAPGHRPLVDSPSRREIMIVGRQSPRGVQMIGQEHPGLDHKGMLGVNHGDAGSQYGPHVSVSQKRLAAEGSDRKEIRTTIEPGTTVIGHG